MNIQELKGNATFAGGALTVVLANRLWVSIRPKDKGGLDSLVRYGGMHVDICDLAEMVPEIRELRFTQIEWGGDLSQGEWSADTARCRVNIQAPPLSELSHKDSMQAWRGLIDQLGGC